MGLKLTPDRHPPITSQSCYPLRHAALIAQYWLAPITDNLLSRIVSTTITIKSIIMNQYLFLITTAAELNLKTYLLTSLSVPSLGILHARTINDQPPFSADTRELLYHRS